MAFRATINQNCQFLQHSFQVFYCTIICLPECGIIFIFIIITFLLQEPGLKVAFRATFMNDSLILLSISKMCKHYC